jgi:type I restriction enzyme S subunit
MNTFIEKHKSKVNDELSFVPLGDVFQPSRPRVSPADKPNLPFIGMEHVEAHTMKLLGTVPAGTMKSSSVHFQPGDVLYGRLRPYLNKVCRPDFEGLCSAEFIVFPNTPDIDTKYLQYFLNSYDFVSFATHLNEGDRPRVDFKQIAPYPFPLAPLPQQRRIVEAIELQLGRLDAAVAGLVAAKAKLKRYKQAVLKAAFTENDWPVTSIGDVYEVFVGSTPSRAKPALWNGNVPWVSSGEVAFCELHDTREKIAYEALGNSEKRLHPSGTVMLAMIGEGKTRGQAAILRIAAAHNQNTAAIRMPDSLHSPEYLYYFFLYEYEKTRRVGSGNNQKALNKTRIQAIEIPMPEPEIQSRVALEIAGRLDQLDEMEITLDAQLAQSTRLRQAVLKRAFEGRLGL